jgi:NAD(P)-dependent dehydrogenase (short-subunit alcohol dehydrogenase family)
VRSVSIVTGASQGIGREIAVALARRGDAVALAARSVDNLEDTARLVEAAGGGALVVETDVTVLDSVEGMATAVLAAWGRIDHVIANSGVAGPSGVLWEIDPDDWEACQAVNVRGVFNTVRATVPPMIAGGGGSIVVIGSISGKRPLFGRSAYTSTKMALVGLTRTLAVEAGPHGIRVNLVSPGFVAGPRIEWVIEAQAEARGVEPGVVRSEFESESPLGRLTEPADVAAACVYLTSESARSVTGVDLNVNSGVVMY